MKVFYSPYTLTPLKRANRLSSLDPKPGILLKGVLGDKVTFADYFPHLPLGDRNCEQFLQEFKFQNDEYDKKVFDLLLRDYDFQKLSMKKFYNHQLWTGVEPLESKVIKYKMLHSQDRSFMQILEKGLRLRLDSNALFKRDDFVEFLKDITDKYWPQIDYIEDPLSNKDWKDLKVPAARDFILGEPFDYYIYKPNCEFQPKTDSKIIFSSYLGSDFGRWHTYCEVVQNADLSLIHGIISPGFFKEEKRFIMGSYKDGFIAEESAVKRLYQETSSLPWKSLCSM